MHLLAQPWSVPPIKTARDTVMGWETANRMYVVAVHQNIILALGVMSRSGLTPVAHWNMAIITIPLSSPPSWISSPSSCAYIIISSCGCRPSSVQIPGRCIWSSLAPARHVRFDLALVWSVVVTGSSSTSSTSSSSVSSSCSSTGSSSNSGRRRRRRSSSSSSSSRSRSRRSRSNQE